MLEQSHCLLVDQLTDHVAEDCANSVEALIGRTDIRQANVIKKNFLNNEDGDGLAQLRSSLHDTKTERNDLGSKQEVDNIR